MARILACAALASLLLAPTASSQEGKGCDGFRWPVAQEQSALNAPVLPVVQSGSEGPASPAAFKLSLKPAAEAGLPKPPERAPKQADSSAGFVSFAAPARGAQQVSISASAWVDVIQDGQYLKPVAFSGAVECPGIRKTVRFDLKPAPFTLQLSDVADAWINILVAPVATAN